MIALHEADEISKMTGVTKAEVERVLRYLNMTQQKRDEAEKLRQYREDHDL